MDSSDKRELRELIDRIFLENWTIQDAINFTAIHYTARQRRILLDTLEIIQKKEVNHVQLQNVLTELSQLNTNSDRRLQLIFMKCILDCEQEELNETLDELINPSRETIDFYTQ